MPDQSHSHGPPSGGDTPLVALTAASNRREWDPVHYLHMYGDPQVQPTWWHHPSCTSCFSREQAGYGRTLGLRQEAGWRAVAVVMQAAAQHAADSLQPLQHSKHARATFNQITAHSHTGACLHPKKFLLIPNAATVSLTSSAQLLIYPAGVNRQYTKTPSGAGHGVTLLTAQEL